MKLNYAPQAGLRRREPKPRRETTAFWAGILIVVAFEVILMAKNWTPDTARQALGFFQGQSAAESADDS
jgi:hypothetical protein